ncbi:hypothetical protein O0I10_007005 [Lichtheimia ornata]|uniref:MIT domain-containing protein n=1 Tax=Lichtheimia ornata TaxID=688661 RepID=A0AAD7V0S4_9FUNG|nr:uncharacterized protein O0I10_007005 [Lichtheimia ornata]KAJ8657189.1 hypothetical protein O0I10_007005 [Lichtheimia ornata]
MSAAAERIATPTNYDEVVCFRPPPPPYEKVANGSSSSSSSSGMLSKVMSVWRRQAMAEQQGKLSGQAMMVDKKQVEHAVTLINIATEMDHSGNHQMAVDLYMMGLDRMLSAFPLESNPNMKRALESKIMEISHEKNLDLRALEAPVGDSKNGGMMGGRSLSDLLSSSLVLGAIVLKKSPVPDMFSYAVGCARAGLDRVDGARRFTWGIASHGIAKAAELDRHFEIHQTVDHLYQSLYAAVTKASTAYAETPGFREAK